jgi:hypothetical protein
MPLIAYLIMTLGAERVIAVGAIALALTVEMLGIRVAAVE